MTQRPLKDKEVRNISKRGASYSVTLPIEAVRKLGWRIAQKVTIKQHGSTLIIKDWRK